MNVLDSLFSILPIVIAVIWVLGRIGRTRKNSQDQAGKGPKGGAAAKAPAVLSRRTQPRRTGGVPAPENLAKWIAEKAREVREAQEASERSGVPPGEDELYARLDNRRIEPSEHRSAVPAPVETEEPHRVVDDAASPGTAARVPESSVLDRIADMPPLARGVLWSVILDEPPALKEPPRN